MMTGLNRKERFLDYLEDNVFLQVFIGTLSILVVAIVIALLTVIGFMLHWIIGTAFVLLFISGFFATIAWLVENYG